LHDPYLSKTHSNKSLQSKHICLTESTVNHFVCGSFVNKLIFCVCVVPSVCGLMRRFISVKIQKCGRCTFNRSWFVLS